MTEERKCPECAVFGMEGVHSADCKSKEDKPPTTEPCLQCSYDTNFDGIHCDECSPGDPPPTANERHRESTRCLADLGKAHYKLKQENKRLRAENERLKADLKEVRELRDKLTKLQSPTNPMLMVHNLRAKVEELEKENERLKKQVESHRACLDKITRHRGFHDNLAKAELAKEF